MSLIVRHFASLCKLSNCQMLFIPYINFISRLDNTNTMVSNVQKFIHVCHSCAYLCILSFHRLVCTADSVIQLKTLHRCLWWAWKTPCCWVNSRFAWCYYAKWTKRSQLGFDGQYLHDYKDDFFTHQSNVWQTMDCHKHIKLHLHSSEFWALSGESQQLWAVSKPCPSYFLSFEKTNHYGCCLVQYVAISSTKYLHYHIRHFNFVDKYIPHVLSWTWWKNIIL